MHIVKDYHKPERAFLIGIHPKNADRTEYEYSMAELEKLTETAGIIVVQSFIQALDKPDSATLIGSGKLKEIISLVGQNEVSTLIFNDNLSSSQAKNIAKKTHCNIVDRTELILDIFAKHAKTHESRLQVELAQLEYSYSKLRNLWQHFSRIVGGVGVRGPGEKQIEIDRRLVRERISILKNKLEHIKKITETKTKKRAKEISICLVGYTNAGKSTLFNLLTKEDIYTADKLFATLDATTRTMRLSDKRVHGGMDCFESKARSDLAMTNTESMVITDTIGFIDNFPPALVQSFYSTLHEVRTADLLLHVIDVNNPKKEQHIATVNSILKDLNAFDKDIIHVFNKCDTFKTLHNKFERKKLADFYQDSIFISAKTGENVKNLKNLIKKYLEKRKIFKKFIVPSDLDKLLAYLRNHTDIQSIRYDHKNLAYECETYIDKKNVKNIQVLLDKTTLLKYVNS